jgi:hypothetical protein
MFKVILRVTAFQFQSHLGQSSPCCGENEHFLTDNIRPKHCRYAAIFIGQILVHFKSINNSFLPNK